MTQEANGPGSFNPFDPLDLFTPREQARPRNGRGRTYRVKTKTVVTNTWEVEATTLTEALDQARRQAAQAGQSLRLAGDAPGMLEVAIWY